MHNEHTDAILRELEIYGLRGELNTRGKHQEVRWQINGQERYYITSRTPSDRREVLNARAGVRRMLRADNAQIPAPTSIQKAFNLPATPLERQDTKVARLEGDVGGLLDIIADLQEQITNLSNKLSNAKVVATLTFDTPTQTAVSTSVVVPEAVPAETRPLPNPYFQRRKGHKRAAILAHMPLGKWVSMKELVPLVEGGQKDLLAQKRVSQTLLQMKKEDVVENGQRGWWRRKPLMNGAQQQIV